MPRADRAARTRNCVSKTWSGDDPRLCCFDNLNGNVIISPRAQHGQSAARGKFSGLMERSDFGVFGQS